MIPHFQVNRLTDGRQVCEPHALAAALLLRNVLISVSARQFSYTLSNFQGLVLPEGLNAIEFSDRISNRIRDLSACNAMPQPLRYRVTLYYIQTIIFININSEMFCMSWMFGRNLPAVTYRKSVSVADCAPCTAP